MVIFLVKKRLNEMGTYWVLEIESTVSIPPSKVSHEAQSPLVNGQFRNRNEI